jgi:hypothetical protein
MRVKGIFIQPSVNPRRLPVIFGRPGHRATPLTLANLIRTGYNPGPARNAWLDRGAMTAAIRWPGGFTHPKRG